MKDDKLVKYLEFFKSKENVFVCFKPSYDRFFVYAHGGLMCQLPLENNKRSSLILFSKEYTKYLYNQENQTLFDEEYKSKKTKSSDERFEFIVKNWNTIMLMMKNRAELKNINGKKKQYLERQRETIIAKNNYKVREGAYVVCDIESGVSNDIKKAQTDLVAVCVDSKDGTDTFTIAYIEYKCTASGIKGTSLTNHYKDMKKFMDESKFAKDSGASVKISYKKMLEYGLIQDDENKGINIDNATITSKIVFLFTNLDQLKVNVERECNTLKNLDKNICFLQEAEAKDVYFSEDNFEEFFNGKE